MKVQVINKNSPYYQAIFEVSEVEGFYDILGSVGLPPLKKSDCKVLVEPAVRSSTKTVLRFQKDGLPVYLRSSNFDVTSDLQKAKLLAPKSANNFLNSWKSDPDLSPKEKELIDTATIVPVKVMITIL